MKELIDIHTVLSTPEDMDDYHDNPEEASDTLNMILHTIYQLVAEDINRESLEGMLQHAWEYWHRESQLTDIDDDDLRDWVDQMLATWDDADSEHP